MPTSLAPVSVDELRDIAKRVRKHIVTMVYQAQSGHPGGSLSSVELGVSLFWNHLRCDPADPTAPGRDRFFLSKGHATPFYYSILAERGFFSTELLGSFRTLGSPLQGHPSMGALPGIEMSGGSLGQGLSFAIGQSLAGRLDKRDYRCWVLMGDGELNEGQVWEAAMSADKYALDNLVAIVDRNGYQQTGASDLVLPLQPLPEKWRASGWEVFDIDGHDWGAVTRALRAAVDVRGRPAVIIARTVKGYGVSQFTEDSGNKYHGVPLNEADAERAIEEVLSA